MVLLEPQLRSVVNHDGAVILSRAKCQITTLDTMGAYVWRQLELGVAQEEIIRDIAQRTGESVQIIESDMREFLKDLASRSLITIDTTSPIQAEE